MNNLLETYSLLAKAVCDDPFLLLANAVAWLDPLWTVDQDDIDVEGDGLSVALYATRGAFPEIYAGAVERIRASASLMEIDRFICGAITQRGIPLDNLEMMGFGIPLSGVGAVLDDPELYTQRSDLLPVVALFGIDPEVGDYSVEVPEAAYIAGRIAADSLMKANDERWRQVGWALAWLFSCSGNSIIDLDDESLMEIPPLSWEVDEVAFAVELIEEADGILHDVNAGLELLVVYPDALRMLGDNVKRIFQAVKKRKGTKRDEPRIRLEWSSFGDGNDGAAVTGVELLHVRGAAA